MSRGNQLVKTKAEDYHVMTHRHQFYPVNRNALLGNNLKTKMLTGTHTSQEEEQVLHLSLGQLFL